MGADVDNPYDVVGVNRNMVADNLKKRQAFANTVATSCLFLFIQFSPLI